MKPRRTALLGLLIAAMAIGSHAGVVAEPTHKAKRGLAGHPARTAPDITATIAKPSPPTPDGPGARDTEIPVPIALPAASRARMRACGETWRDMKLAGTTGDDDWREFAFKCFVGKSPTALAN